MISRLAQLLVVSLVVAGGLAPATLAAPPPTTTRGTELQELASGLHVPTAFAFGGGHMFAADGGPASAAQNGGVYLIAHGRARLLPGSPAHPFGLSWHGGRLYLSARSQLQEWSDFDGAQFRRRKVIYTAPAGFTGFNGIGFGADGRLYAAVSVGDADHGATHTPYARDVLSFTSSGRGPRVVARGIRQPWQLAFPHGSSSPYVSDLGQDQGATNPPDFILRVSPGQDYGFSACNWTAVAVCQGDTRPFHFLPAHANAMGLGILGQRLYMSEFGSFTPPRVVSMPLGGGRLRTETRGFVQPIVGLATHGDSVYVGELTGQIWRFRPSKGR